MQLCNYARFPLTPTTKVSDTLIDLFSNNVNIETTDRLSEDKIYFVGGPKTSLDRLKNLYDKCIPYINIDKGYLSGSKSNSHWRCTYNALQQTQIFEVPNDRLKNFNLNLKPWKTDGSYILILAPNSDPLDLLHGYRDTLQWSLQIRKELLKYTDRKIFIRFKHFVKKGHDPIEKYFDDCYAIVTFQSIGVVQATMEGIPCINLATSCLDGLGPNKNKISDIEKLNYYDNRYEWLKSLSYGQFTKEEIQSGFALDTLRNLYNL